uniref:Uncharacterized protein n=1 Tax=Haptolina ericina TaxID=156174 RepID=A0A7S3BHR8_9EUKA
MASLTGSCALPGPRLPQLSWCCETRGPGEGVRIRDAKLIFEMTNAPIQLVGEAVRRFQSQQAAYRLTATGRWGRVVVATPLSDGPPSWICGPPVLVELATSSQQVGQWVLHAAAMPKERALSLSAERDQLDAELLFSAGEPASCTCGYSATLSPGRSLRATLDSDRSATLSYVDRTLENRAVWAASGLVRRKEAPWEPLSRRCKLTLTRRCNL